MNQKQIMATTVISAFNEFLSGEVNLDSSDVTKARSSRDWLLKRVASFDSDVNFPKLCDSYNMHYGSFSRRTKIRPLDDIDIMIGLHGQGGNFNEFGGRCEITIGASSNLHNLCHANTSLLNSRKVIESFKGKLSSIDQYKNADIKRNQEAVTLSLISYDWVFDLVPAYHTNEDIFGKSYYLIPDGNGHWKKTNPQIDQENVTSVNKKNGGNILNIIRIFKYWNARPLAPKISSYLLENILIDYFNRVDSASQFVDVELEGAFRYLAGVIQYDYNDPKSIQGNINNLTYEDKQKIRTRALKDADTANLAREYERKEEMKNSLGQWSVIFGPKFPTYG